MQRPGIEPGLLDWKPKALTIRLPMRIYSHSVSSDSLQSIMGRVEAVVIYSKARCIVIMESRGTQTVCILFDSPI